MRLLLCVMAWVMPGLAGAALNIFACEPEWAALAQQLAGDEASVYQATTARQDPHRIEARPSLIARMRKADLVVCAGAELEAGWLPLLQRQASNKQVLEGAPGYFEAALQVERLEVHERVDRSMGDVHGGGNPHVHLDPYRLLAVAEQLNQRLQQLDPEQAAGYRSRFEAFRTDWQQRIPVWEKRAESLKGKKVLVHHKSWTYLLDWLGIQAVGDLEPKPGLPPTAGHLAKLLRLAEAEQPFAILVAAYMNPKSAAWLEEKTGARAVVLPFTVGGDEQSGSLVALYDRTLDLLLEAARP